MAGFILTAVSRKKLAESYNYVASRAAQGFTRKQWETGNIPVVFAPASVIEKTRFMVAEACEAWSSIEVRSCRKETTSSRRSSTSA